MTDRTEPHIPTRRSEETRKTRTEDVRGKATTTLDRSAHRRHAWHYEDLQA